MRYTCKMKKRYFILIILFVAPFMGWAQQDPHASANITRLGVLEVLQTKNYTYILGDEGGKKQWIALPSMEATVGEVYYRGEGLEMNQFKSTELDRVFDSVIFLQSIESARTLEEKIEKKDQAKEDMENLTVPEGGITIAELYKSKTKYAGKQVIIRGQVVKYNGGIMGKNWIHLQDGSDYDGNNDITVTTTDKTEKGAVITIQGVLYLNKDFGAGYAYDCIIEEAKVKK